MPKPTPDQLALDFSSKTAEALAALRSLPPQLSHLPADLAAGVADLLERVALCSRDRTTSHARVAKLAAGIDGRRAVSERTVRRWRNAAEQIETTAGPLLHTDHRSHHHGGHRTNAWTINWPAVRLLLRGEYSQLAADRPALESNPAPTPGPAGPMARRLAELAMTLTEDQAATLLATWQAGHRPATDRTPTGHHDHPKAGHHDRPKAGHHDRPTVVQTTEHPPNQLAGEWRGVIDRLKAAGLATAAELVRLAAIRGDQPAAFEAEAVAVLATARANAASLRSPTGAAAWKLRTGTWPDGLTLAAPALVEEKARSAAETTYRKQCERLAYGLLDLARRQYQAGRDPAAIRDTITAGQPPAVLELLKATAWWSDMIEPQPAGA